MHNQLQHVATIAINSQRDVAAFAVLLADLLAVAADTEPGSLFFIFVSPLNAGLSIDRSFHASWSPCLSVMLRSELSK
jgi:hypothetical protein